MAGGARLVVERNLGVNAATRSAKILIDGKVAGKVRNGHRVVLPIAPGARKLQVRVDWVTSKPLTVDVAPGDQPCIELKLAPALLTPIALLGLMPYFKLRRLPERPVTH